MESLIKRNRAIDALRTLFFEMNLVECHSPLLQRSAAIEPYLDAFKIDAIDLFLPTSAEFSLKKFFSVYYKQYNGVYEIAHCFRKEELSKWHRYEFTMVEWYQKEIHYLKLISTVTNILRVIEHSLPEPAFRIPQADQFSLADLFARHFNVSLKPNGDHEYWSGLAKQLGLSQSFVNYSIVEIYSVVMSEKMEPLIKERHPFIFVYDYPSFTRGMSQINEDGWAMRVECYLNGVEVANGYQEMLDAKEIKQLWMQNNQIRLNANKPIHPIDESLLKVAIHQDYAGMAMGLERAIAIIDGLNSIESFGLL